MTTITINGSAVCIGGKGVLILGRSMSGKSELALKFINMGATLIADDRVLLTKTENQITMHPHPKIHGLLHSRRLGFLELPAISCKLDHIVELNQLNFSQAALILAQASSNIAVEVA